MSVFFNALTVDPCAIDAELEDAGAVGPELAFIAKEQRLLPRALCWRDASSDWPLLIVQIPGTEALWMLQHPVFTPIIRRWGMARKACCPAHRNPGARHGKRKPPILRQSFAARPKRT
ncbi:MAG: hypothetical protein EBX61_09230 [Betaproteobacteria bacterium]|nr:hypothetical protein [Betaproteobacteria bacterium]